LFISPTEGINIKSDGLNPFVRVKVSRNYEDLSKQTEIATDKTDPVWSDTLKFEDIPSSLSFVTIVLLGKDRSGKETVIGSNKYDLKAISDQSLREREKVSLYDENGRQIEDYLLINTQLVFSEDK